MIADLEPYRAMKDSGAPWLGDVPAHWDVLPSRALFTEVRARGYESEQMLSVTISNGVVRQADLLRDSSKKDSSNEDKGSYKLVHPGDIAYNKMRAWQGAIGVSRYQGIVSPAYIVMRPREGQNPRYFHYLLRTPAFAKEAERWSYGITSDQWSLRPEHFKMIRCACPPEAEQDAIVRFLDHADRRIRRYIRAKQRLITLLEEQKQAIIQRAVTCGLDPDAGMAPSGVMWLGNIPKHWVVHRLRNVCQLLVSGVDKHAINGELPARLCNYVDVYKHDRITSDLPFMHATVSPEELDRFRLRVGDVVITKDSEAWNDIGVPSLVEYEAPDFVCGYHLAILRPYVHKITGTYLLRVLQSQAAAAQCHVSATGVTRYGLSHEAIKSVWVPVPPFAEQADIARYVDRATANIVSGIERAQREISLLREFTTRLVTDVVTGQLDVRASAPLLPNAVDESEMSDEGDASDEDDDRMADAAGAVREEVEA